MLAMHVAKELMEIGGGRLVEVPGRLIGEEQGWMTNQRTRNCNALLFTAGKRPRSMDGPIRQPHPVEQCASARFALAGRKSANAEGHFDVFERRELRQQMVELEDEPDVPVPEPDARGVVHLINRGVADANRAGVEVIEATEDVQEGALPHA